MSVEVFAQCENMFKAVRVGACAVGSAVQSERGVAVMTVVQAVAQ